MSCFKCQGVSSAFCAIPKALAYLFKLFQRCNCVLVSFELDSKLCKPKQRLVKSAKMSESHFDEYEHYNYDSDKHINSGNSGKQRTKKEVREHTNHFDPSGHSRKITTKLQNTEQNKKENTTTTTK